MTTIYGVIYSDKICRSCLDTGANKPFFELGNNARFFTDYLNIEMQSNDINCVCMRCLHLIRKVLSFGDRVLRANSILQDVVQMAAHGSRIDVNFIHESAKILGFDTLKRHAQTPVDSLSSIKEEYFEMKEYGNSSFNLIDLHEEVLGIKTEDKICSNVDDLDLNHREETPDKDVVVDIEFDDADSLVRSDNDESWSPAEKKRKSVDKTGKKKGKKSKKLIKKSQKYVAQENRRAPKKLSADVSDKLTVTILTKEQAMEEQQLLATKDNYLNSLYKCTVCFKGIASLETYQSHMELHSESAGSIECEICHKRYKTRDKYTDHLHVHMKRYHCKQCGQQYNSREVVLRHWSMVHEEDQNLPCAVCNRFFKNSYTLSDHMMYAHGNKKRPECKHCGQTFTCKSSLKQHCKLKHSENLPESSHRHICEICGHKCFNAANLKIHMAKHSSTREFYCADCDISFKTRLTLQAHLKTTLKHGDPEKLILCAYCPCKFRTSAQLGRHVRDAHQTAKVKCELCWKEYPGKSQLKKHKRFAHEGQKREKRYVCDVCGRAFAYKPALLDHMNIHTGARPYKCDECPSDFGHSGPLYTHKKMVHNKDKEKKRRLRDYINPFTMQ